MLIHIAAVIAQVVWNPSDSNFRQRHAFIQKSADFLRNMRCFLRRILRQKKRHLITGFPDALHIFHKAHLIIADDTLRQIDNSLRRAIVCI